MRHDTWHCAARHAALCRSAAQLAGGGQPSAPLLAACPTGSLKKGGLGGHRPPPWGWLISSRSHQDSTPAACVPPHQREREREGGGGERGGRGGKNWPAVSRDHRPLPLRGFEELRALSEQLAVTDKWPRGARSLAHLCMMLKQSTIG